MSLYSQAKTGAKRIAMEAAQQAAQATKQIARPYVDQARSKVPNVMDINGVNLGDFGIEGRGTPPQPKEKERIEQELANMKTGAEDSDEEIDKNDPFHPDYLMTHPGAGTNDGPLPDSVNPTIGGRKKKTSCLPCKSNEAHGGAWKKPKKRGKTKKARSRSRSKKRK